MSNNLSNKTLEELEVLLEKSKEEQSKAFNNLPMNLTSFEQIERRMAPTNNKVAEISRKIRMIKPYELEEIPDYGNVMTLKSFISCCNSGGFIDYDGSGNYIKDGKMTDITILPSDVKHGTIRKEFDKIIWFNR